MNILLQFKSFFKSDLAKGSSEKQRKLLMLDSISIIGVTLLILMNILLIHEKSYFYAIINIIICSIIIIFFVLVNRGDNFKLHSTVIIIFVQFFFLFLFHSGAGNQMAFIWFYLYPLISFFILGINSGLILSLQLILTSYIINLFSSYIPFFVQINDGKIIRIILSYSGVLVLAYIFEKTRSSTRIKYETTLKELNERAIRDSLTGLYNRRYMDDMISRIIDQCSRNDMKLGFIMADIDFFKNYNDTYGHQAGDEVLLMFSKMLESNIKRKSDFIFRYGGEEFFIILSSTTPASLENLSDKIIKGTFELSIPHKTSPFKTVTVSAGAVFTDDPEKSSFDDLINLTDKALYKAKNSGRNCYVSENCSCNINSQQRSPE